MRELSAQMSAQEMETTKTETVVTEDEKAEAKKRQIYEFANDPDAYIDRRLAEREFKKELPAAEQWIKSQDGFAPEDETKVMHIIREHGLQQPSPMLRAKAAWKILQAEKLEKEFSDIKADRKRENTVTKTMPDSTSRSVSTDTKPKRSDLIAQLKTAAAKGDSRRERDLINLLEDVRE